MNQPSRDLTDALRRQRTEISPYAAAERARRIDRLLAHILVALLSLGALVFTWAMWQ